jgi:hypothetical protein
MRYHFIRCAIVLSGMVLASAAGQARGADGDLRKVSSGEQVNLAAQSVSAGPIRAKLEEGELRYLRVGDEEIVRRIYFAVRDGNWATAMPKFTHMKVDKAADHFTVLMAAECRMGKVDFAWTGTITGTADGKITFHAEGTPGADFDSNRIGLCVLLGTPSLAGQEFETDGTTPAKGTFPALVSPTHVADQFHKLAYVTSQGLHVSVSSEGAIFDMEDQRNWGDSSWKAYAPLPYAYKHVGKGDVKPQTITLMVSGANTGNSQASPQDPVRVEVGKDIPGFHMPTLIAAASIEKPLEFTTISFNHDKFKGKENIAWSYIPTTHLPDNDTIMENLPAITDQARTVAGIGPVCPVMSVGPIRLNARGDDPRSGQPIAAAWAVGVVGALGHGHVKEAAIDLPGEIPAAALDAVRPFASWQLMDVATVPRQSAHVLAFGCFDGKEKIVFLVNKTAHPWHAELVLSPTEVKVLHVAPGAKEQAVELPADGLKLDLGPYEVCRVRFARTEKR